MSYIYVRIFLISNVAITTISNHFKSISIIYFSLSCSQLVMHALKVTTSTWIFVLLMSATSSAAISGSPSQAEIVVL